jgi:ubiquinone/menaquinone biosynthesis C-methylase UbiE
MSWLESAFCRNTVWNGVARRDVLPWALQDARLRGEVLDIGGGTGAMAEKMAQLFPGIRVTTTDIDPVMVQLAQRRLDRLHNADARHADVTALPFADATFDCVTSFLMLHHVQDWETAVAEVARVLRPGGVFVGYDLTRTVLARLVHWVDRSPHRLVSLHELEPAFMRVGLGLDHVDASARGHLFRFSATRRLSSPP